MTPRHLTDLLAVRRLALDSLRYYDLKQIKQGESRLRQALAARKQALRSRVILFDGPETEDVNIAKRAGHGPDALVTLLFTVLGLLARDLGQFAEAESRLLDAIGQKERIFGADHREVAPVLQYLTSVYEAEARYDEAEPPLLRSLTIVQTEYGSGTMQEAWSLYHLANLYHRQGRIGEAMPLMREAVRLLSAHGDTERHGKEIAVVQTDYAALLHASGRAEEAERLDKQVEEIWKKIG